MKLMKATRFRTRYFEKGSQPDMKTIKKWIDDGEVPGQVMGAIYYVDLDRLKVSNNPLVNKVLAA
jgi:hypothetical protein